MVMTGVEPNYLNKTVKPLYSGQLPILRKSDRYIEVSEKKSKMVNHQGMMTIESGYCETEDDSELYSSLLRFCNYL